MQNQASVTLVFDEIVNARVVKTGRSISIIKQVSPLLLILIVWAGLFSRSKHETEDVRGLISGMISPARLMPAMPTLISLESQGDTEQAKPVLVLTKEQKNLVSYLSISYRVDVEELGEYIATAYAAAKALKVDPLLVLAIMSIESSFDPDAQSHAGAQGLMQVLTRVHADKFVPFGGVKSAFDVRANILVGTQIIQEYIKREGSVESALKSYVGAALMSDDGGYGWKVLGQRARLLAVAQGKPIPKIADQKPNDQDPVGQQSPEQATPKDNELVRHDRFFAVEESPKTMRANSAAQQFNGLGSVAVMGSNAAGSNSVATNPAPQLLPASIVSPIID